MPPITLQTFRDAFSAGRMEYFEDADGDDPDLALRLYDWHIDLNAALLQDLGIAEVLIRNAMSKALCNEHGEGWPQEINVWDYEKKTLDDALAKVGDRGLDTIVANLSFGFWSGLLDSKYNTRQKFWPVLKSAFSHGDGPAKQDMLDESMSRLNGLRNDVAHHKILLDRSPELRVCLRDLKWVTGLISPDVQKWMLDRSEVQNLLDAKPSAPH
jgi:hypothetical protein